MTATKKSIRFLTVLALIFTMVFSIATVSVSAESAETCSTSSTSSERYVVNPTYLSPVMTMEKSGQFIVTAKCFINDTTVYTNDVKCTLQIRSANNGEVLASKTVNNMSYIMFSCSANVYKGQQVQIYMSAFDAVTGETRYAVVTYDTMIR